MRELLCQLTLLLWIAIIVRVILSWFPLSPQGIMARLNHALMTITDPILEPLRRVLPRTGFIDLSPVIALLALQIIVRGLILGC